MILDTPKFNTRKEFFDFVVENEELIFDAQKSKIKKADGVSFVNVIAKEINASKEAPTDLLNKDVLEAMLIINTTNVLDSHKDVHIPGLWDKSLKENKRIKLLQEHQMKFDKVIANQTDVKPYAKNYSWRELGIAKEGETQALVFEAKIRKNQNSFMHEQYAKGLVDNHSVGMQYVKLATCINDEDYPVQKENWDKYYDAIINKEEADASKIFWAVLEAKCIEGSAVVMGSNTITPTQEVKQHTEKTYSEKYLEAVKNWAAKH
jgi:hypothetical protein